MTRFFHWCRISALVLGGCMFAASGCLSDNFWSTLLSDTVIAGGTAVVVDTIVNGALGN